MRLTIYFTSDTHGYLYPTNFADDSIRPMGVLSMAFPKDGNTLVIDGGDSIQGSPLTYYCHQKGLPTPVAEAFNDAGYDYVTLGNHDFNYGRAQMKDYLTRLNAKCLCANVSDLHGELPLLPYAVHTLENGLRVGLVGIVTDWIKVWEKPENLADFVLEKPVDAARRALCEIKADVLVGVYHGGVERDLDTGALLSQTDENLACKLCEELPFDLLLTGHQHIAMADRHWCGTHLAQTPCNASAYVKATLDEAGVWHSELCDVVPNACVKPSFERLYENLTRWLDTPIGRLSRPIWPEDKLGMALHGSPIADFFNRVQLDASGADLSCAALANDIRGFDSAVTVRDVVASYVYSNTLVVLRVTGAVLRRALEQCATYFDVTDGGVQISSHFLRPKEAHYNFDYFSGVEYAFDLRRPAGQRVATLRRGGQDVKAEDSFTLCMCNYRATGAGDFECYLECPRVKEIQTEVSELILNYLTAHPFVEIPIQNSYQVVV